MRATGNKVFLVQEEYKSENGIVAPLAEQGMAVFKVAAVGPGEWNVFTGELRPMPVKVGDRVIADIMTAPEITITKGIKKTTYRIIPDTSIQMILEDDEVVK
jgi:co-chaperonin GroES (HSP10)